MLLPFLLFLLLVQVPFANIDGYFYRSDLASRRIRGYVLTDHGGFWADIFLIAPLAAWLHLRHDVSFGVRETAIVLAAVAGIAFAVRTYEKMGLTAPEAYTHDGTTTIAGYLHAAFALIASWIILLAFFGRVSPALSGSELVVSGVALTVWAVMGVVKFNPLWRWTRGAVIQILVTVIVIWSVVGYHLAAE